MSRSKIRLDDAHQAREAAEAQLIKAERDKAAALEAIRSQDRLIEQLEYERDMWKANYQSLLGQYTAVA